MKHFNFVPIFIFTLVLVRIAIAQQTQPSQAKIETASIKIFAGQTLEDAVKVLRERKIDFHEGGFSFVKGDPDHSNLFFTLDDNHTWACVYFLKSSAKITGLSLIFFPAKESHRKLNESWIPAQELTLHADNSYMVHFAAPATPEQLRQTQEIRPPSELPRREVKP